MKKLLLAILMLFQLSLSLGNEAVAVDHFSAHTHTVSIEAQDTQNTCDENCHDCANCHCSHQHNQIIPLSGNKAAWAVFNPLVAAHAYQLNEHLVTPRPLLEPPAHA